MEHFFENIHGWFMAKQLYADAVAGAQDGDIFVEIGAWKGRSAAFMAVEIINSGKAITFNVIDHWKGSDHPDHHFDPDVVGGTLFDTFKRNLSPINEHNRRGLILNPIRLPSQTAVHQFTDNSLTFVFIDGEHDYENVKADIAAWKAKVRPGGVLAGDDYGNHFPGVIQAVDEMLPERVLLNWPIWAWAKPV